MRTARFFSGPVMIFAGVMHFVKPRWYMAIMPPWLPAHRELVYASGVAEAGFAAATLHPRTRRIGGLGLVATLIGIFPANVHMALNPADFPDVPGGRRSLLARLPLQGVFVLWAWRVAQSAR
jgi:uncharacterized membrane protein